VNRRRLLALVVGIVSLAFAATAFAAKHHERTVLFTLGTGDPQEFYGSLTGGPKPCWVGRKVILQLGPAGEKPEAVGSDLTSTNGDWYLTVEAPLAGYYRGFAPRFEYKHHGVKHVCDAAASPRVLNV
jgi:hypothetical protein